jgi:hypothetical protein
MTRGRRTLAGGLLLLLSTVGPSPVLAQIFTPQAATGLSVSFQNERLGGSRVLLFGDVRNTSSQAYERVVLLAEGLDADGAVVSRARSYVSGTIPARGSAAFEIRLLAAGTERRYRVTFESYQVSTRVETP